MVAALTNNAADGLLEGGEGVLGVISEGGSVLLERVNVSSELSGQGGEVSLSGVNKVGGVLLSLGGQGSESL